MSTSTTTQTSSQPDRPTVLVGQGNLASSAAEDAKFQAVARGNRGGTLKLRGIPTFSNPHEERKWMREHMAAAFRFFGKQGYGEGISGHISMRGTHIAVSNSQFKWQLALIPFRSGPERPFLDESLRETLFGHESVGLGPGR